MDEFVFKMVLDIKLGRERAASNSAKSYWTQSILQTLIKAVEIIFMFNSHNVH